MLRVVKASVDVVFVCFFGRAFLGQGLVSCGLRGSVDMLFLLLSFVMEATTSCRSKGRVVCLCGVPTCVSVEEAHLALVGGIEATAEGNVTQALLFV